jgi:hypothetical protein
MPNENESILFGQTINHFGIKISSSSSETLRTALGQIEGVLGEHEKKLEKPNGRKAETIAFARLQIAEILRKVEDIEVELLN